MAKLTVKELLDLKGVQQERIAAYREYIDDVGHRNFPAEGHSVSIDDAEFEAFVNSVKQ